MKRFFVRWLGVMGMMLAVVSSSSAQDTAQKPTSPEIAPGSAPACTAWATNHIDCFVVGNDLNVWQIPWNGGLAQWGAWTNLGYPAMKIDPLGGISVVSRGANMLDLFVIGMSGTYGNLYQRTWNGTAWGPWINLSGPGIINVYETTCTSTSTTNLECFIRGSDSHLWERTWNGSTWGAWTDLGTFSSPSGTGGIASATYSTASLVVYAIGSDGHAYRRFGTSGALGSWIDDSFPTGYPLRQVSCHAQNSTTIDCAFTDSTGGVWHRNWNNTTGWSAFLDLGYPASASRGVALTHYGTAFGGIVVMANASDGRFYRRYRDVGQSTWSMWLDQGRPRDLRLFIPVGLK